MIFLACIKFASRAVLACRPSLVASLQFVSILLLACSALAQNQPDSIGGGVINPQAIAFSPSTGKVYAVDTAHGSVDIYNDALQTKHRVKVGAGPVSLAVNAVNGKVYVANAGDNAVSVLDGATNAVIATIPVGSRPYSIAANSTTGKVYVSHTFSDQISVIDGATNIATNLKTGSIDLIAVNPRKDTIYLLGYEGGTVKMLDGAHQTMTTREAGMHAWGMIIDQGTGKLLVGRLGTGDVAVLDSASSALSILPAGPIPCAIAVNIRTNTVYTANYGANTISVVDVAQRSILATVPVGNHPQAIAFDALRNLIYVANKHSDSVTVIDASSYAVLATLPAGKYPYAIAVVPGSSRLYVSNEAKDTQSTVVDLTGIRKSTP